MDIELLKTFLAVRQTRHFARAAESLYVTQAAVSARIRQLETLVGQPLFTRHRNNIQLTTAGHQLVPHAESILASWERALMETAHHGSGRMLVSMGCLPSLREIYLDAWLEALLAEPQNRLLQVALMNTNEMVGRIRDGSITLGILYEPPTTRDLWIEPLTRFDLLLVSTSPTAELDDGVPGYIHVDWGSSFSVLRDSQLAAALAAPQLKLDSALLAMRLMLAHGGSAYLPSPMISAAIRDGRLFPVAGAPIVQRTVHLIGREDPAQAPAAGELVDALRAQVVD